MRYGKGEHNRLFRERFGLHRLALHAAELTLLHPSTGAPLRIEAPLPEDLRGPFTQMGLPLALPAGGQTEQTQQISIAEILSGLPVALRTMVEGDAASVERSIVWAIRQHRN